MKITDYGLWYGNFASDVFTKVPDKDKGACLLHLNGTYIGPIHKKRAWVKIFRLTNIGGFKVSPNSPGELQDDSWNFPQNYIPSESDFEKIE